MKSGVLTTIAVLLYSAQVNAIRSTTVASSLLGNNSDRPRSKLLKIRGGDGGSSDNIIGNASSVTVVPEETLPQAISGMSSEAFRFKDTEGGRDHANISASSPAPNNYPSDTATTTSLSLSPSNYPALATIQLPNSFSPQQQKCKGGDVETATDVATEEDLAMKSAKWNGLRNRILSAAGMIASLGGLAYYGKEDGLSVFVVFLQAMMFREMSATIGGEDWGAIGATLRKYWWFATAAVVWNGPKVYPWMQKKLEAVAFGMTVTAGVVTSVLGFQHKKSGVADFREYIRQAAVSLLSAALVILPSSFWIGTLEDHGMKWVFAPAALVAINDIMAYVFGKLLGKHPLLPSISPNKTWEGFLGAAFSTVGTAWVGLADSKGADPLLGPGLEGVTRMDGMVLATFASLVAPFAGFFASVIKRAYGRKDFGNTLPGHGGFVDRLDCQLILAPFVYFYLALYKFA